MVSNFDANDSTLWYFDKISRNEAEIRLKDKNPGMFLIRDSNTSRGSYVLCVSENCKVSHYIINKHGQKYKIGDQEFASLAELIEFYKIHYLDTTTLLEPCPKGPLYPVNASPPTVQPTRQLPTTGELVKALYDFKGNDDEDLPFIKGDILTVLKKDEEQWWTAMNTTTGKTGSIPKPYVEKYIPPSAPSATSTHETYRDPNADTEPRRAIVTQQRMPSAYDPTQLKLEVGDKITILSQHASGQWKGTNETTGKNGSFPFTHVRVLTDVEEND